MFFDDHEKEVGEGLTLLHEDLDSAVDQDTLLHGETLLIVSTGDSEGVSLELGTENLSVESEAIPLS